MIIKCHTDVSLSTLQFHYPSVTLADFEVGKIINHRLCARKSEQYTDPKTVCVCLKKMVGSLQIQHTPPESNTFFFIF